MKAKKAVAMVVMLMGLVGVFAPGASAAPAWYNCTVTAMGMNGQTFYVQLTDTGGTFTTRWFTGNSASLNQLMAVALTAMTNDILVVVNVEPTEYSVLSVMYLYK